MTLREILDTLPAVDRKRIMAAFNSGQTCIILLPDRRYIGVNTSFTHGLIPDSDINSDTWSKGRLADG